jgi:hypothetical protein
MQARHWLLTAQKQLVGLAVHLAAVIPTQNKRKYINALVIAYLIDFEQLFAKPKRGCPNKTKKTYFKAYKRNFKGIHNGSSTCTH